MKVIRIVGLGIAIWGVSLVWPQVNQALTPPVMIGLTLGLGAVALGYTWLRHIDYGHEGNGAGRDHPSRPIPITATR